MSPEELRIGNYIRFISTGDIEQIYNIVTNTRWFGNDVNYKDIEPIPLTEEWLLKFGFKRVKHISGVQAAYKLENIRLNMSNCANFYRYKLPVDSVHQLQNLYFALTQKELTCT